MIASGNDGWTRRLAVAAIGLTLLIACEPTEQAEEPVLVVPMGDAAVPDAAPRPMDMEVDAPPAARVLVKKEALSFPTDNRVISPTFDPRAAAMWLVSPQGGGVRVLDHRLPFDGPALRSTRGDNAPLILGRVRLSAEPMTLSLWIGVNPADDRPPEEAHAGRTQAEFQAYTPDRDAVEFVSYGLIRTDELVVGHDGMVWQRYEGRTQRPTLGLGWLVIYGLETVAVGAPVVQVVEAEPMALRRLPPLMTARPVDPALKARIDALVAPRTRPRIPERPVRPLAR